MAKKDSVKNDFHAPEGMRKPIGPSIRPNPSNIMHVELVASMKAPEALVETILKDPKLVAKIQAKEDLGYNLASVLKLYTAAEQNAGISTDNKYIAGGHAINFQRSNLYNGNTDEEVKDLLLRKGNPNPNCAVCRRSKSGKIMNSEFVRMQDINNWPVDVLNSPVSIEFNAKKKNNPDDPIESDVTGTSGVTVYFRVNANLHMISKDEVDWQEKAAKDDGRDIVIKKGYLVFQNSIQPSNFESYQGMGEVQFQNSKYIRDNLEQACKSGNNKAIHYFNRLIANDFASNITNSMVTITDPKSDKSKTVLDKFYGTPVTVNMEVNDVDMLREIIDNAVQKGDISELKSRRKEMVEALGFKIDGEQPNLQSAVDNITANLKIMNGSKDPVYGIDLNGCEYKNGKLIVPATKFGKDWIDFEITAEGPDGPPSAGVTVEARTDEKKVESKKVKKILIDSIARKGEQITSDPEPDRGMEY